jgi:hypothetical protein
MTEQEKIELLMAALIERHNNGDTDRFYELVEQIKKAGLGRV